jgi:2-dehydropantoate 2-reductase
MRILVLGAGAIGGYYGLRLAEAGADVSFLVREGRAAALGRDGLVVVSRGEETRRAVPHCRAASIDDAADLILLACKAFDLDAAIEAIAPAVRPGTVVLPLLNGLAHFDALDARFGKERVLGGAAYIAVTLGPDGVIRHTSPGDLIVFGARDGNAPWQVDALAALFAKTPVTARASDAILQDLWEKWVMLAAGAGLTCLMRGTVGEIMVAEGGRAVAEAMIAECRAIADAHGHAPRPPSAEQTQRMLTDPASRWAASMMRDLAAGAPRLETDAILGDLVRRGAAAGIAAPMLSAAHCQLQVHTGRAARG